MIVSFLSRPSFCTGGVGVPSVAVGDAGFTVSDEEGRGIVLVSKVVFLGGVAAADMGATADVVAFTLVVAFVVVTAAPTVDPCHRLLAFIALYQLHGLREETAYHYFPPQ